MSEKSDGTAVDGNAAPVAETPAAPDPYHAALDAYMAGRLQDVLAKVDEALAGAPEAGLKSRLERLRRRATDRLTKEPAAAEPPAAPAAEATRAEAPVAPAEAPKAEEPKADAAPAEEPRVEEPKADAPAVEEPRVEEPKADAPAEEPRVEEPKADAPALEEPRVEEPKADAPALEEPRADASAVEEPRAPAAEEPKAPAAEPAAEAPAAEAPAAEKPAAAVERPAEKPAEAAPKSPPPKARAPKGGVTQVAVSTSALAASSSGRQPAVAPKGAPKKAPSSGSTPAPVAAAPSLKPEVEKLAAEVHQVTKTIGAVEHHIVKVAEAYQKLAKDQKRKDQAYDQLYEELRQYKTNFIAQQQKPLLMDIILLFDALSKTMGVFAAKPDPEVTKQAVAEALGHLRDEVLELLYRRDIELISDKPTKLDVSFQKPVERIDTDKAEEDRDVVQVLREGFRSGGSVLRPQDVVVKRTKEEKQS